MATFYVYEHWRADKGECFYVGKGTGRRAHVMSTGRNNHHKRVRAILVEMGMPIEIRLVASGLDEALAYEIEKSQISKRRAEGYSLVNRTDGGEGVLGMTFKHTDEAKAKIGDAGRGRKLSPEHKAKVNKTGFKHSDETKAKIAAFLTGRVIPRDSVEKGAAKRRGRKVIFTADQLVARRAIYTPERNAKISAARKRWWAERKALRCSTTTNSAERSL